jgi:hypothetical protein
MPDGEVPRRSNAGWTSENLPLVAESDGSFWSVANAAELLGPPKLSEKQVRNLIDLLDMQPVGKRTAGPRRRHVRVYSAIALITAFEKVAEALGEG